MENLELDTAIEELETRVERLRSLYEQYFMGIEKIAPAVAHKDVTRRIDILRHEQIRNTAKRFRLQMIIQRYNTFQQYWLRILREIENGTYKRHVLRAERTMATSARTPSVPSLPVTEPVALSEAPPESDRSPAARQRKSAAPSASKHALPSSPRHSSLPPPEKVEAFTRALERDLAAALDGDLDFGSIKGDAIDSSFDLDGHASARMHAPEQAHRPTTGAARDTSDKSAAIGAVRLLKMPAQSAIGGHRLPPAVPKAPVAAHGDRAITPQRAAAGAPGATPVTQPNPTQKDATVGLTTERIRQLHRELSEAKAKTNDKAEVSLSSLTRRLEATRQQLSQKHSGKQIDFAVVIKDGKAVLKPIVR